MRLTRRNQPASKDNDNNRKGLRRFLPRRPIRSIVKEETAGGVVFRRTSNGVEILMIQDAKGRWTIPKGHIEPGERLEETAIREIREETGLKNLKILDRLGKNDFQYRRDNALILMVMHVFLIEATNSNEQLHKEDWMKDIKWFKASQALDMIEYESISTLFLLALKRLRNGR